MFRSYLSLLNIVTGEKIHENQNKKKFLNFFGGFHLNLSLRQIGEGLLMETARWKKLEAIYHSALAIEPNEREEFLQNICGDDEEMLCEVKALLDADSPTSDFLKDDNFEFGARILAEKEENMSKTLTDYSTDKEPHASNLLGGRYQLLDKFDKGGIGEVYLANDNRLQNKVVIKFLQNEERSNWIVEKFKDEPVVQSRVSHPNIAKALDKDVAPDGRHYLVMEYIEGADLSKFIKKFQTNDEFIPFETVADLIRQAGNGVNEIHLARLVHRDLKPANLMLSKNGFLKVIDFGIARDLTKATSLSPVGTANYMASEQLDGQEVSAATDVFALGVISYQLLTLRLPFMADDRFSHIRARQEGVKIPPTALRPDLPKEAEKLIVQALAEKPEKRPQSAKDFGEKLAEILTRKPEPISKPNYFKPLAAVAAILILALAGWWWLGSGTKTVKADEIVKTRPQNPVNGNNPETVSQSSQLEYDAELEFPMSDNAPSGTTLVQVGLNFWHPRPATSQDDRTTTARVTNDLQEETVQESKDEFIKDGGQLRLSVEAMTKGFLSEGSGYVYIVNREQYSDGTFGEPRLIFPELRAYKGNNLLKAGKPIILPRADGKPYGIEKSKTKSNHIAETYTIIVSPWAFQLPKPLSNEPMILPNSLFADWERQYADKMYRAVLRNDGKRLMTIQEQKVMSRSTDDLQEVLTQSDTETFPQIVYRGAVKIGNPAMFTVILRFKD
jgi:serine/threonine protein kinase